MAVLSRLVGRVWNLICLIILAVFFAFPLAILACFTTSLAVICTWILAFRMVAAAIYNRIDTWRSNDQPGLHHDAQIQGILQPPATSGPSLLPSSGLRPSRIISVNGPRMPSTNRFDGPFPGSTRFVDDPAPKTDYDYDIAGDNDEDDSSEALWLGGWRRRSSPNPSRSATALGYHYRHRSSFGENSNSNSNSNSRGTINNNNSPYYANSIPQTTDRRGSGAAEAALYATSSSVLTGSSSSVVSSPQPPPSANVAARRSTTSVGGSRRSSRVLSAESVRREMEGDG